MIHERLKDKLEIIEQKVHSLLKQQIEADKLEEETSVKKTNREKYLVKLKKHVVMENKKMCSDGLTNV